MTFKHLVTISCMALLYLCRIKLAYTYVQVGMSISIFLRAHTDNNKDN